MYQEISWQSVAALADKLTPVDRLRLVERIAADLVCSSGKREPTKVTYCKRAVNQDQKNCEEIHRGGPQRTASRSH